MVFYYFKDASNEWRWHLKGAKGRTIAESGEGYKDEEECLRAIDLVKKSSKSPVMKGAELTSPKLYVGNLSFEVSGNELHALFAQAGEVQSVAICQDRRAKSSRGFGFVEMSSQEEADAAIEKLHGRELLGRPLIVSVGTHGRPKGPRGKRFIVDELIKA